MYLHSDNYFNHTFNINSHLFYSSTNKVNAIAKCTRIDAFDNEKGETSLEKQICESFNI